MIPALHFSEHQSELSHEAQRENECQGILQSTGQKLNSIVLAQMEIQRPGSSWWIMMSPFVFPHVGFLVPKLRVRQFLPSEECFPFRRVGGRYDGNPGLQGAQVSHQGSWLPSSTLGHMPLI